MSDDPAKPPRFPYVTALLCAACVTAAVWTWMRYSYAWALDFGDGSFHYGYVNDGGAAAGVVRSRYAHYAEVRGLPAPMLLPSDHRGYSELLVSTGEGGEYSCVLLQSDATLPPPRRAVCFSGRVLMTDLHEPESLRRLRIDATASRFTWQSITGLVVGAMGVFVFAVYLRHWLKERRAWRKEAEEA